MEGASLAALLIDIRRLDAKECFRSDRVGDFSGSTELELLFLFSAEGFPSEVLGASTSMFKGFGRALEGGGL